MALSSRLQRVLDWLLEGYPTGVPPRDYIPVLALLGQRLTEEEVRQVAAEVARRGVDGQDTHRAAGGDTGDIGVHITRITDALPRPEEIARVQERLVAAHDWPFDA